MTLLFNLLHLGLSILVFVAEGVFWVVHFASGACGVVRDAWRSRNMVCGGLMRCPSGHEFAIEGEELTFECNACGFVYSGRDASQLQCPNRDCASPVTAHIACPICSLSVPAPFRWGKR